MTAGTVSKPVPTRGRVLRRSAGAAGREWPLSRIVGIGAAVAALLAAVSLALGAAALVRLDGARTTLLDVSGPCVLAAGDLLSGLVNQETGVRGFALSSQDDLLGPYRDGRAAEADAADRLRRCSASGGFDAVAADLDAVERLADGWRAEYVGPVLARSAGAPGVERGRELFDGIRAAVTTLQADVNVQRLAAREQLAAASAYLTAVGVLIAGVFALVVVAALVGLRRFVLRPVSDLAAQVRNAVSGGLAQPVRVTGPREIVALSEDVEAMRQHIQADLDEVQTAMRALDEQAQELERSNRDLEQFAYVASHDLQEPLRKVSSFCQLLQRRYGGQLDERADQYIEFAVDGASRMQQLINDLLAFSRVGRTTAEFTAVPLDDVAAAAAAQLGSARDDVDGTIEVGPLPTVSGDVALLRQLVLNLIGNGLKFHRDGVPPVVRVAAERRDDQWEITVADNGIGIEPEYADKVFVIFQRLHARDRYAGTGIGLALAKKIVEFHGGRIAVDPPGDEPGTTVRFSLPAPQEDAP